VASLTATNTPFWEGEKREGDGDPCWPPFMAWVRPGGEKGEKGEAPLFCASTFSPEVGISFWGGRMGKREKKKGVTDFYTPYYIRTGREKEGIVCFNWRE